MLLQEGGIDLPEDGIRRAESYGGYAARLTS